MKHNKLSQLINKINPTRINIKKIVIVGGGKIGRYIAGQFSNTNHKSKFINKIFNFFPIKDRPTIKIIEKS